LVAVATKLLRTGGGRLRAAVKHHNGVMLEEELGGDESPDKTVPAD
jgi:hypothetical protein